MATPVFERMLDLFEAEGIKHLIGIPDPNFVHLFVAAERRGWTVIAPHHEESSGFMAEAVARMTGKPAVCIATLGPGVANAAGAMMCALVENSPVIFIGGQRARITEQRVRRGRIQFIKQMALFENSVKYSASIEYASQTDEIVQEAIRTSLSGVPGPSYIEFPSHVILEELDLPEVKRPEQYRLVNQGAGAAEVAAAIEAIQKADNPIILCGHGVHTSRAGASVAELAKLMGCPVIQTSGGTSFIEGVEDRTFPYGFSEAAVDAVVTSDVCVAIGTELGEPVHYGKTRHWAPKDAERTWIYIEQDATAIGVNRPIDIPLVGDLRAIVPQLVAGLSASPRGDHPNLAGWIESDATRLRRLADEVPNTDGLMHTGRWVVEATKAFPENGIMVRDGGATVIFQWTYSQAKPHDVVWNQNFGHLGTGLPYALGASLADGCQRPVMLLTSDSAFMFHIGELEVAARLNMPLVVVVGVDFQWGLEVGVYKRTFGKGATTEPGVHWSKDVRFDKVAEGLGCQGMYVDKSAELGKAIKEAYASGKPTVIHVPIDPEVNSEEMPNYEEFRTWYAEGTQ
jgi:thiamine pyrophosphate-dependent acetolactate synthase large subunit-like protein